jgi:hypothetical protein
MRGANQCKVRQSLRKVSLMLPARSKLLGKQSQVVSVPQRSLEDFMGLFCLPAPRQALRIPE